MFKVTWDKRTNLDIGIIFFHFLLGPNAEQALIHKLEGGDTETTTVTNENEHDRHGCHMAIAKFLDCMCFALRA